MTSRSSLTLASIGLAAVLWGCGGSSNVTGTGGSPGGSGGSGGTAGAAGESGTGGTSPGTGGTSPGGGGTSSGGGGTGGAAGGNSGGSSAGTSGGAAGSAAGGHGGIGGQSGHGGGTGGAAGGNSGGAGTGGQAGVTTFALTSTTLANGGAFPTDATCDTSMATSQLPDLSWTGAPSTKMSFALALVDTSLINLTPPNANGFHWVMWDISPSVSTLPQGLPAGSPPAGVADLSGSMQKRAPSGTAYLGPCPNFPSATHTKTDNYEFRLYALSQSSLPSNLGTMTVQQIVTAIEAEPPIATAVLHGTSNAANTALK